MVASEREREWLLLPLPRLSLERLFRLVVLALGTGAGSGSAAARVGDGVASGSSLLEGSFAGVLGIEVWEPSVDAGRVGIPVGFTEEWPL